MLLNRPPRHDEVIAMLVLNGLIGLGFLIYLLIKRLGWLDPIQLGKDEPEPVHAEDER